VNSALLNPVETWKSSEDYQKYLDELVKKFQNNFKKFDVGHDIISAGPKF
jgi:phosphoenolpyruvate carboxykinase (ATP)